MQMDKGALAGWLAIPTKVTNIAYLRFIHCILNEPSFPQLLVSGVSTNAHDTAYLR